MVTDHEKFLLYRIYRFKDQEAYNLLYVQYVQGLNRHLSFKLPRKQDSEDLTTEVFLRAWEYCQNTHVENFSALVYRIARNSIADFYRQRERSIKEVELDRQDKASDQFIEEEYDEKKAIENIEKNLKKLKDEYRDVIIMRYMDELTVKEIAIRIQKTENASRVLLHRALKALRKVAQANSEHEK